MYFTENRYDRSIESMMKGIPNFYPRGSGIVVTSRFEYTADMCDCRLCEHYGGKLRGCKVPRCVCLEERIAVGVASLKEVMKETMSEIKHSGFLRRLRKYIKESEVIPMTFLSEQHRLSFNAALDRIGKFDRKNCALVAALYLLTADFRLWNQNTALCREPRYQLRQAPSEELYRRILSPLLRGEGFVSRHQTHHHQRYCGQ